MFQMFVVFRYLYYFLYLSKALLNLKFVALAIKSASIFSTKVLSEIFRDY